ncbi:MAG: deaminase [Methylobacterium brachiatum]|jgi:2-iminobutanoate/2-iminopropanoate deaminase|nr:deaminase [Methylobacterium brachiatum]
MISNVARERKTDLDRIIIATEAAAPAVGPYAQATRVGDLVFASGQLPIDPETGAFPVGIEAQTRRSLANLAAVLKAGGASLESVAKTTVFLKDMNDFAAMNAVYAEHFPGAAPARSTIEVARLPRDALVEVEAIALATGPAR